MKYCPYCGNKVEPGTIYCINCGKNLLEATNTPVFEDTSKYGAQQPPHGYQEYVPKYTQQRSYYRPIGYQRVTQAPMLERFVALIIDEIINQFCCIYDMVKDGLRDGRSIGKGLFNLRVIDYHSGYPASLSQSFIRNCVCGWLDVCTCYITAFIDEEGRRIGDHVAGTMVIQDI
ncbi:MAG: RDD family protein [Candidatus Hodarchaeales archaeon]